MSGPRSTPEEQAESTLAALTQELGAELVPAADPSILLLARAAEGEPARLRRWLKRYLAGEPVAYIVGSFEFGGLRFAVDKRAYVTDPELTYLVEAVVARARALGGGGRPLHLAEIGVGCGSVSIAVERELPGVRLTGLDLDPDALAVAARNVAVHGSRLRLVESDLFEDWPGDLPEPDLIFGDPPWGDATTLYAAGPDAGHYQAMPPASAFPLGGRTAAYRQILASARRRGWTAEIWLNGGVLPEAELAEAAGAAAEWKIVAPRPGLSLLRCRAVKSASPFG